MYISPRQNVITVITCRDGKTELQAGMIATFTIDQQSSRELRQYLTNVVEQCACSSADDDVTSGSGSWCSAPRVVVIDNLHHVTSLGDAFGRFLSDNRRPHRYDMLLDTFVNL